MKKPVVLTHELEMEVRDYELDLLGMVNNAVYLNYLEHARHQLLKTLGVDFSTMFEHGYRLVVTRSEVDYKHTLQSGEKFQVRTQFFRESRVRFCFQQHILRTPDQKPVLVAKIIGTCLNKRGRPLYPPQLAELFDAVE